jgi:hypothetical protein|tara:strand:- start:191 stop:508 length:318 start_codon:yes stop_codon:yes gene_type:complete
MRLNNEEEEDDSLDLNAYNLAVEENKEKILNKPIEEVSAFFENMFSRILDLVDQVEQKELGESLTAYLTISTGTLTESILELRNDNEILWNENNLGKHYQTPELN